MFNQKNFEPQSQTYHILGFFKSNDYSKHCTYEVVASWAK